MKLYVYKNVEDLREKLPQMSNEELEARFRKAKMWIRIAKGFLKRGDKTAEEDLQVYNEMKVAIEKELLARQTMRRTNR